MDFWACDAPGGGGGEIWSFGDVSALMISDESGGGACGGGDCGGGDYGGVDEHGADAEYVEPSNKIAIFEQDFLFVVPLLIETNDYNLKDDRSQLLQYTLYIHEI